MGKKLRIGLLGAGRIGNLHGTNIQNFVPDAEVVIVADPFMNEQMEAWAKSIGIARCSKDPEDVFSADDVDAVFICSSTNTHAEFMISCQDQRGAGRSQEGRRQAPGRFRPPF